MTGLSLEEAEDIIREGKKYREKACDACDRPDAVRSLVNFLFPMVGKVGRAEEVEGHIGAPSRLYIALHMHIGANDVSLIAARRYLLFPEEHTTIEAGLTVGNCLDFLEKLGEIPVLASEAVRESRYGDCLKKAWEFWLCQAGQGIRVS